MIRREHGFTIVEILMAILIVAVGVLAIAAAFDSSRRLDQFSQRKTEMAHQGQMEIERVTALPYAQIAMTAAPSHSGDTGNPDYYIDGSTGQFTYNASQSEPIVTDGTNGTITPHYGSPCTDGCTSTWSDGANGYSGEIFTFVSLYTDTAQCGASCQYKQVTVAVTMNGTAHPATVWETTYKAPPSTGTNVLTAPTTTCQDAGGQSVSCTNGLAAGTAQTYYLTDSPYTATYAAPGADHAVHNTLGTPDQSIVNQPSAYNSDTAPPCYSTDIACPPIGGSGTSGGMGREVVPVAASGSSCGSPPQDKTKLQLWVTPSLTANTTVTGGAALSLYTRSDPAAGSPVPVTLCLALYLEPQGTTTFFSNQIGNTVAVGIQSYPTSVTPISFDFNTGGSASVGATGARVGIATWIASAPNNIVFVYDHPSYASSIQLILQ